MSGETLTLEHLASLYPHLSFGESTSWNGMPIINEVITFNEYILVQKHQGNPLFSGAPLPCIGGNLLLRNYGPGTLFDMETRETITFTYDNLATTGNYSELVSNPKCEVPDDTGIRAMNGALLTQNFYPLWRLEDGTYAGWLRGTPRDFDVEGTAEGETANNAMEEWLAHIGNWNSAGELTGHKTLTPWPWPGNRYSPVGAEFDMIFGSTSGSGVWSGYCNFSYVDGNTLVARHGGSSRGGVLHHWNTSAYEGNFDSNALIGNHGFFDYPITGESIYGSADKGSIQARYALNNHTATQGFQGINCFVATKRSDKPNDLFLFSPGRERRLFDFEYENFASPLRRISRDGANELITGTSNDLYYRDMGMLPNGMTWWSSLHLTLDIDTAAHSIPDFMAQPFLARISSTGSAVVSRFIQGGTPPEGYSFDLERPKRVWMVGNKVYALFELEWNQLPTLTGAHCVAIAELPDIEDYFPSDFSLLPRNSVPDASLRLRRGQLSNLINENMRILNGMLEKLTDAADPAMLGPIDADGNLITGVALPAEPERPNG